MADTKQCGTCKWFDPSFAPDDTPEDSLGSCEWPSERLPLSLEWGNRERRAVTPLEGVSCSCYEHKGNPMIYEIMDSNGNRREFNMSDELTEFEAMDRLGVRGRPYTVRRWPTGKPNEARTVQHMPT